VKDSIANAGVTPRLLQARRKPASLIFCNPQSSWWISITSRVPSCAGERQRAITSSVITPPRVAQHVRLASEPERGEDVESRVHAGDKSPGGGSVRRQVGLLDPRREFRCWQELAIDAHRRRPYREPNRDRHTRTSVGRAAGMIGPMPEPRERLAPEVFRLPGRENPRTPYYSDTYFA